MFTSKLSFMIALSGIILFSIIGYAGEKFGYEPRREDINKINLIDLSNRLSCLEERVIELSSKVNTQTNPRNNGRYMVTFKDGSKLLVVTFEKTGVETSNFSKGKTTGSSYIFHLETGIRVSHPCNNVDTIVFINFNSVEK
jgi:hypothetical protein